MTSNNRFEQHLQALVGVLDEYTHWYMQLLRRIQYPKNTEEHQIFNKPVSFMDWLEDAQRIEFKPEILERLQDLYSDLSVQADTLVNESLKTQSAAEYEEFDKLMTFFEEFTLQIRRLERDSLSDDSGLDDTTGLRSKAMLDEDFDKEMERVSRQGKPFSLALIRINNPDDLNANKEAAVKLVSDLIKKSMRSFDDAYRLTDYEFVLSLKQADTAGGMIALKRLEKSLVGAELEGPMPKILSCISEPAPGDNLDQLVNNIRQELDGSDKKESGIIEYIDISPLQRFVKQGGD